MACDTTFERDEVTNRAFQLLGFGQSERITLDRLMNPLHPDDREPVNHAMANSFNGTGAYKSEYRRPIYSVAADRRHATVTPRLFFRTSPHVAAGIDFPRKTAYSLGN